MLDLLGTLFFAFVDVPLTWTGERVVYVLSAGRRKPRYTVREIALGRSGERLRGLFARLWLICVGLLFWVVVVATVLLVFGPLKPIHEWRR